MIYKLTGDELADLQRRVEDKHGQGWFYQHTVRDIGPDGREGTVDVFDNRHDDWDSRRMVLVLNGKVLSQQ